MSKIAYVKKRFSASSMEMIVEANDIVDEERAGRQKLEEIAAGLKTE